VTTASSFQLSTQDAVGWLREFIEGIE